MAKKENNKDKTSFMKSFKAEIKKVIWPTPKQLFNNTIAVLAIVVITTIIVFALDFTFGLINEKGIDKIKQHVSNSATVNENTSNAEENTIIDAETNVINNNTDEATNTVEE